MANIINTRPVRFQTKPLAIKIIYGHTVRLILPLWISDLTRVDQSRKNIAYIPRLVVFYNSSSSVIANSFGNNIIFFHPAEIISVCIPVSMKCSQFHSALHPFFNSRSVHPLSLSRGPYRFSIVLKYYLSVKLIIFLLQNCFFLILIFYR